MFQQITALVLVSAVVVAVYFETGFATALAVLVLWLIVGHLYNVQQRAFALIYVLSMAVKQLEEDQ